jgi:hypothetical protein
VNQSRLAEEMTDYAYYKAKKFKIPLDKAVKMWYNECTRQGEDNLPEPKKSQEKVEKTS